MNKSRNSSPAASVMSVASHAFFSVKVHNNYGVVGVEFSTTNALLECL